MGNNNKRVLLDTNVLIYDTDSIYAFRDSEVLISETVLEELDNFKEEHTERGMYSREVVNKIKNLLTQDINLERNFRDGVIVNDSGGILKIVKGSERVNLSADKRLILEAKQYKAKLILRDNNLFLRANGDDVIVEEYKADKLSKNDNYKGYRYISLNEEDSINFMEKNYISNAEYGLFPNEFALITLKTGRTSNYGRTTDYDLIGICKKDRIVKINLDKVLSDKYNGVVFRPQGIEQKLLAYLLNDDDIKLVTVEGASGKGKTLLSIDYVKNAVNKGKYDNYIYTKSVIDTDESESLGYLKGGLLEKFLPNLKPLNYSLEAIHKQKYKKDKEDDKNDKGKQKSVNNNTTMASINTLMEDIDLLDNKYILNDIMNGELEIIPLAKTRGITIDGKGIILDEAQNVKRHTMKTFTSRIKDNSKAIITGDNDQIDDHNLNKYNNGFSHLIENGKEEDFIGHITLDLTEKTQRGVISQFSNEKL